MTAYDIFLLNDLAINSYNDLIIFLKDGLKHDRCYAIDTTKT